MLIYFNFISVNFSNTISSKIPTPIDFKFYVRHHGEGLNQSYGNYADSTIFQFLPICSSFLSCHFSNASTSEGCGPIDFKFHGRHSGDGLVMEIMQIEHVLQFCLHFSAKFSNAISSEVPWLINFQFYVMHPGEGLYQSYGNYVDTAIFSAERKGPWASCSFSLHQVNQ